jgi:hypothetical protein
VRREEALAWEWLGKRSLRLVPIVSVGANRVWLGPDCAVGGELVRREKRRLRREMSARVRLRRQACVEEKRMCGEKAMRAATSVYWVVEE